MKKVVLITIGVVVIMLFAGSILYTLFTRKQGTISNTSSSTAPPTGDLKHVVPQSTPRLTIQGRVGKVQTANFLMSVQDNLNGYVEYYKDRDYVLGFDGASQNFYIKLNSTTVEDFNQSRSKAERQFLTLLDIAPAEACTLFVQVTNFKAEDPSIDFYQGPLSFCSDTNQ